MSLLDQNLSKVDLLQPWEGLKKFTHSPHLSHLQFRLQGAAIYATIITTL